MSVPTRCAIRTRMPCIVYICAAAGATALAPAPVLAHTSDVVTPGGLMHHWQPDPFVIAVVLVAGWLHARGRHHLERVAGAANRPQPLSRSRSKAFWIGLATLLLALASPLDTVTGTALSAHMVQHILLIAVAPPLILLGRPLPTMIYGLPRSWRRPLVALPHRLSPLGALLRWLTAPVVAFALHTLAVWLWHVPPLYQAAVRQVGVHLLEHSTFFLTAILFWWELVPTGTPTPRRIGPAMAILSLFGIGMQGAALGMVLTFRGSLLYPVYQDRSELWGLSAISDQRLAGLLMWIPAGSIYLLAALLMVGIMLATSDAGRRSNISSGRTGEP